MRKEAMVHRLLACLTAGLLVSLTAVGSMAGASAAQTEYGAFSWGNGDFGALGNGSASDALAPVRTLQGGVLAGKVVSQIAGGDGFACALASDGTVACWGDNSTGQLGNGTLADSAVPVAVSTTGALAGKRITQVQASTYAACALASDGTVACWGDNSSGQLGNASLDDSSVLPVAVLTTGVLNGRRVTSLAPGGFMTVCAVLDNGTGSCWGSGVSGTLGNGLRVNSNVPVLVDMGGVLLGRQLVSIAGGHLHMCAVTDVGTVVCWGPNGDGQLGTGSLGPVESSPVTVLTSGALSGQVVTQVSAAFNQSCALTQTGAVVCWGANIEGQLGIGAPSVREPSPTAVDTSGALSGQRVAQVTMGVSHTCARTISGLLTCWGAGSEGQLGNGIISYASSPTRVDQAGALSGWSVNGIVAGGSATYALATRTLTNTPPPPTRYTLSLQANEGTCWASEVAGVADTWVSLPDRGNCYREGFAFMGWNTSRDGAGLGFAPGAATYLTGDNSLFAQWRRTSFPAPSSTATSPSTSQVPLAVIWRPLRRGITLVSGDPTRLPSAGVIVTLVVPDGERANRRAIQLAESITEQFGATYAGVAKSSVWQRPRIIASARTTPQG